MSLADSERKVSFGKNGEGSITSIESSEELVDWILCFLTSQHCSGEGMIGYLDEVHYSVSFIVEK